ncbi:MAG: H-NS histone family protein [Comamonadaceae bacterium]|nr:H-NS histone family protein [Comamonadaceae bacterium]
MNQLTDLLQQREALDQQIRQLRQQERSQALAEIQRLVNLHELSAADIFGKTPRTSSQAGKKVPPRFMNKETGETWTGRGKPPRWIRDKDFEQFRIPNA